MNLNNKKTTMHTTNNLPTCLALIAAFAYPISANAEDASLNNGLSQDNVLTFDAEKEIEVIESQVAFVPFAGDANLAKMVFDNLQTMPLTVTSDGLIGQPHTRQDLQATLPAWQQFGIPYLVIGQVNNGGGITSVQFDVVEVANGRLIKGKNSPHLLQSSNRTELAQQVAGRIYELITDKHLDLNARIAYIEQRGQGSSKVSSLIIANSDGSNRKVLAEIPNANMLSVASSPDGRYLAYAVQMPGTHFNLFKYDLITQQASKVTTLKGDNWAPSFSADGRYILFTSSHEGDAAIYRVSSNGGDAELIFDKPYEQFNPSYMPDGSFVFASDHDSPNRPSIYRYNTSGSISRLSRGGYATNPNYNSKRNRIAYLSGSNAAVMDTRGNNIANFGSTGIDQAPTFSPSGERVVYGVGKDKSNIIIRYLDGGKPMTLSATGEIKSITWVPSGDLR